MAHMVFPAGASVSMSSSHLQIAGGAFFDGDVFAGGSKVLFPLVHHPI